MPLVYANSEESSIAELKKSSEAFKNSRKVSLAEFRNEIMTAGASADTETTILNNGAIDSFELYLSDDIETDRVHLSDVVRGVLSKQSSVLFATMSEEAATSIATLPQLNGDYERVLGLNTFFLSSTTNTSSSNTTYAPSNSSTGIFYKPEGAEYSIYYADTYLYITPDIFTGLMTMLFMVFVLYTGLSCLNAVQGCSSFVSKPIPLGKEF